MSLILWPHTWDSHPTTPTDAHPCLHNQIPLKMSPLSGHTSYGKVIPTHTHTPANKDQAPTQWNQDPLYFLPDSPDRIHLQPCEHSTGAKTKHTQERASTQQRSQHLPSNAALRPTRISQFITPNASQKCGHAPHDRKVRKASC